MNKFEIVEEKTGAMAAFEIVTASDDSAGRVIVDVFKSLGNCVYGDPVRVRLGYRDLAQVLMVFRGMEESVNYGKGIALDGVTMTFSHQIEPVSGYRLTLAAEYGRRSILFDMNDAFTLMLTLERALIAITFGTPSI